MDYRRLLSLIILLLIWLPGISADNSGRPTSVEQALAVLDDLLADGSVYQSRRQASIDSLKSVLKNSESPSRRLQLMDTIAVLYENFQLDSAINYRNLASRYAASVGNMSESSLQEALKCVVMSEIGQSAKAITTFESINPDLIAPDEKLQYHDAGARLYCNFTYYSPVDTVRNTFKEHAMAQVDSVLDIAPAASPLYQFMLSYRYFTQGKTALVVGCLSSVLDDVALSNPLYGDAALGLGVFYQRQHKNNEAAYYLALASIYNLKNGLRNSRSLMALGEVLYELGDVSRAYACLRYSLDNSVASGATIHSLEAARQVPMVIGAFREQDKRKVTMLITLAVVLFILLAVIVVILIYLRREMRSMSAMRQNVIESNRMKETYISHFLNLCSIYLEKLDEFSKMARRKITAGQVDDLYELIRSGKMMDEQSRIFYEKFDDAFTHIFPGFVDGVNALLQPDKQIVLPENGRLTTELRILAFARLGIDDASQIARFLGLSLNTIYTYRNKMRSKAIDRSSFESMVMEIGQIA